MESKAAVVEETRTRLDVYDILEQLGISKAKWMEIESAVTAHQEIASGE